VAYQNYTVKQVEEAIKTSFSWRETIFKIGLNGDAGSNNKTLKKIASENNFDYSHFKGQGWNLGKGAPNAIPIEDLLKKGSGARSWALKKKLVKKRILKDICSECRQLPIWNNKPLVLELDHIDGDVTNNELSNLRILCGHCHSQTPTFRGRKNKKRYKKYKKTYICKQCGKIKENKSLICRSCYNINQRNLIRPDKKILLKEIKESNYCSVGRKYGVSDNCIRKWLK